MFTLTVHPPQPSESAAGCLGAGPAALIPGSLFGCLLQVGVPGTDCGVSIGHRTGKGWGTPSGFLPPPFPFQLLAQPRSVEYKGA